MIKISDTRQKEWFFGLIPESWQIMPLKYLCTKTSIYGVNIPSELYTQEGIRFLRTTDISDDGTLIQGGVFVSDDLVAEQILSEGDFLISRSGTIGRAYVHKNENGVCSYAGYLIRYILNKNINPYFLFYLTKTPNFQAWLNFSAIEATIGNVNGEKYANWLLPVPLHITQNKIVQFLDRETARIDSLIAAKERQLMLLAEKRQVLIARAVTRGLDETVEMKDSGVEWLGEVPRHWTIKKAKWLFKERNERSETGEEEMLSVSHLTGITARSEKNVNMFEAESNEGYKIAKKDDFVINTLWAWMGAMGISSLNGIVSPAYHVYVLSEDLAPGYVDAISRTPVFATEVTRYSKGIWSSRLRLYPEGLYEVLFPVPPLVDQRLIINYIKEESARIDNLRSITDRSISLLKERRAALISAAVTGQIEIPDKR